VQFYIDEDFMAGSGRIGVHPNDNTATVWLQASDLIKLTEEHGNAVHVITV
jgi:Ala-tRNA(Pro) deacylase